MPPIVACGHGTHEVESFNAQPKAPALRENAGTFGWALNNPA
jgi:hypothetical protein